MPEEKKTQESKEPQTVPVEQYNTLLNQHNFVVSAFQKQEKKLKALELSQKKILEAYYALLSASDEETSN